MFQRRTLMLLGIALVTAALTYTVTAARKPGQPTTRPTGADPATEKLLDWLKVPASQRQELVQHDSQFGADLKGLRMQLAADRAELAAALENPASSEQVIRDRLEASLAADAALQRRIMNYLLAVRPHLTTDQQKQLFSLCAEGVRQGQCWQWRQGGGGGGGGMGPGGGGGRGRGGPPDWAGGGRK